MKGYSPTRFFLLLLLGFILSPTPYGRAETLTPLALKTGYGVMAGTWQRTDGNYTLKISDVQASGQARVEYFNPSPIHIATAKISTQKDYTKLFIRFQDENYEGSTYTLYYYAAKDALAGFYYQAPLKQRFEVVFLRKSK